MYYIHVYMLYVQLSYTIICFVSFLCLSQLHSGRWDWRGGGESSWGHSGMLIIRNGIHVFSPENFWIPTLLKKPGVHSQGLPRLKRRGRARLTWAREGRGRGGKGSWEGLKCVPYFPASRLVTYGHNHVTTMNQSVHVFNPHCCVV